MQRLLRLSLFTLLLMVLAIGENFAQDKVYVSGELSKGQVRIFVRDSQYVFNRDYTVYGTLIIEPGTVVKFNDNGRLIVAKGGRVIADGDAVAQYIPRPRTPNGQFDIDPIGLPGGPTNPLSFTGYADLNYFLYNTGTYKTIDVKTKRDQTVHPNKYDYIFNVLVDKSTRRIIDLEQPGVPGYPSNPNHVKIPFEMAIIFVNARLYVDPLYDNMLNIRRWQRLSNTDPDFNESQIKFIGQPVNEFSREWGHIVVLPGARAAFFRNCSFEGFRKDTTVDRTDYYSSNPAFPNYIPGLTADQVRALNAKMNALTNGGGGALTTFSSRTWLLNCEFVSNMARHRGGALQILQAPLGFPRYNGELNYYSVTKNPNITNPDGSPSTVIAENPIPLIDAIDESFNEPLSDDNRMGLDDGRLAVYLGRMRNLTFEQNYVRLSNVKFTQIGQFRKVEDDLDNPATYPYGLNNHALGGAIYIAGADEDEYRKIEIGFGINKSITIGGQVVEFDDDDTFEAMGNSTNNYQNAASTIGARGGAIYVGKYTSLIAAGKFHSNETYTKFLQDAASGTNSGYYSMGGAIYLENTLGRLQVRGGPSRELTNNPTDFYQNKSGAGGAIYCDGNTSPWASPVIGGSDAFVNTRDYGFNIRFRENQAVTWGGAVYTKRNTHITGSGGVVAGEMIGYGEKYRIEFNNNTAGYAGGALYVGIPNANPPLPPEQRIVHIVRASFRENSVGEGITGDNRQEIRGGGAIYSLSGDLNLVKGVEFRGNKVKNGNGGAIAMIHPITSAKRYFITDLDVAHYDARGIVYDYTSTNEVYTFANVGYDPDARSLTRFLDNEAFAEEDVLNSSYGSGSGTTQVGYGTLGTTAALHSTTWLDNNNGYAVGYNGTIIKYSQGGTRWEYQNSGTSFRLTTVYFTSMNTGYVGGDRGIILMTTNGGRNWNRITTPTDSRINKIRFLGTNIGFAVCDNGYVLKTTDAGYTWTMSRPEIANLKSIFFTDTQVGYIVGDRGLVLKTTNAGTTWSVQLVNTLANLNSIVFVDASNGYIVGNGGTVFKTTNGGNTWVRLNVGSTNDLFNVVFTSQTTGYVVGTFGEILKTEDAGNNWTTLTSNTTNHLYDIFFTNLSRGYVVGNYGLLLGTTDAGATWTSIRPADESLVDVKRLHQEIRLPENGVGLGGAIYILDSVTVNRIGRTDTVKFNRVRIEKNKAYTGAAIYSDNFDLKLIFNRSLITANEATSEIGMEQNYISGPVVRDNNGNIVANMASHDLVGAIIYGEIQGPLPSYLYSEAANSIFGNKARFLIRLPDAPNTKGVLAGTTGIGFGGTDTLRGNYWGRTEADVTMEIGISHQGYDNPIMQTFFVAGDGETHLRFLFSTTPTDDPRNQGPFEQFGTRDAGFGEEIVRYTYRPIPLKNADNDENTPHDESIPEKLLFSGHIYDIYDKGTDIKTADYYNRRLSPIEDFAVGIPPIIKRFNNQNMPSYGKYIKRWTRDPFAADSIDPNTGLPYYPIVNFLQDEFRPNSKGEYFHPIGYPLYLEAQVDYSGLDERSNHDPRYLNETVYFVINETTLDYIRVNLKQVSEVAPDWQTFRARVELVPDLTRRNPNTLIRRTAQGLFNLGVGNILLGHLYRDPYKEDGAALPGRRYHGPRTQMGNAENLYFNRDQDGNPTWPADNQGNATHYAGEKYQALPVNVGDQIRIISRTVLWREGVIPAFQDGITFKITRSTEPPVYTGNIIKMQSDTIYKKVPHERYPKDTIIAITEFLNTIFVTEDRYYPVAPGWYSIPLDPTIGYDSRGRDSILTVTAIDSNMYYDPRAIDDPTKYPYLTYRWIPWDKDNNRPLGGQSSLARWLYVDTARAAGNTQNPTPVWQAYGYLRFTGRPINPYVVPGGEWIRVWAENYPPHYRTIDSLKKYDLDQEQIDKLINIFPPYFNAEQYDITNARYLQQDTINIGYTYQSKPYDFRIFVVDSTPRFIEPDEPREEIYRQIDWQGNQELFVVYEPSDYNCPLTEDGKLVANIAGDDSDGTFKLRFKADFNTDDEWEDYYASLKNWDFRYGRTSYGFMNIALRPGNDTTVIDTTIWDPGDYDNYPTGRDTMAITQTRPVWMSNQYIHKYGDGVTDPDKDDFVIDFTSFGKLDIRIPAAEAFQLLTPKQRYNDALNLDTVFTVVVNDGHGGINTKTVPVYVNVRPTIITTSLPPAKEDYDYNPQLLDSSRMIKVFDPNFDQSHTFELIYPDDPRDEIPRDECFPEAGAWSLQGLKTTPRWLKINSESGLLYGTPRIKDAPRNEQVTVVVYDEGRLSHIRTFTLRVDSTNHKPRFAAFPVVRCIDRGGVYEDEITIIDRDLLREPQDVTESVTLRIYDVNDNEITSSFTFEPQLPIRGIRTSDTVKIKIRMANFNLPVDPDGKVTIKIVADDGEEQTEMIYRLKISDATDFVSRLTISNQLGASQVLEWGTAPLNATTGDEPDDLGRLDANLCEFELPPIPPQDVFDARWNIPTRQGTLRNIFPRVTPGLEGFTIYRGQFQSGGVNGDNNVAYPVTIEWDTEIIPARTDATLNPSGASWYIRDGHSEGNIFSVNMKTLQGWMLPYITLEQTGTTAKLTILSNTVSKFNIVYDWATPVEPIAGLPNEAKIVDVSPNPLTRGQAQIRFGLPKDNNVQIDIIDALGNVVKRLTSDRYSAGYHLLLWDGKDMNGNEISSGTYTCRLVSGSVTSTYPFVIIK